MPKVQLSPEDAPKNIVTEKALGDGEKYILQAQGAATIRYQEFADGTTPDKNEGDFIEMYPGGLEADGAAGSDRVPYTCNTDKPLWAWVDKGLTLGAALAIADG